MLVLCNNLINLFGCKHDVSGNPTCCDWHELNQRSSHVAFCQRLTADFPLRSSQGCVIPELKGLIWRRTSLKAPAVFIHSSTRPGACKAASGVSESCPRVAPCNSIAAVLRPVRQASIGQTIIRSHEPPSKGASYLRWPHIRSVHHSSAKHEHQ